MFDYVKKVITRFIGKDHGVNKTPRVIDVREHGIDPKSVSWAARKTCENLQARGYKAYIVGGAVRDLLLGVTPKDFDVATDATPEQVKRCQRRAFIIGRRFRLVHVVFGQEIIECSTFRALDAAGQRKDANGRVISDNVFGEMWEDAARRDFTINAMYYDPTSQEVYDYHGGFEDLHKQRLVMIGDPVERYREDPVRMMRAVRIAAKLGFKMERNTERAIPKMAKTLDNVPAARLFDEMMKLFTSGHAEACLIKLREEGLHRSLLPMLDVILDEKEGEEFLMLALRRTDERIASGKKISPSFLFATLLWPQVLKRWDAYQQRSKMVRSTALFAAADDVIATQCAKLAIQNRFVADMKLIWMLQLRFERRTGKNPYSLVQHIKYRAGYDFMLLRSLLNQVPAETVRWWEDFVDADEDKRREMIREQEDLARQTASAARAGNKAKRAKVGNKAGVDKFAEAPFVHQTGESDVVESATAKDEVHEPKSKAKASGHRRQKTSGSTPVVERKSLLPAVTENKAAVQTQAQSQTQTEVQTDSSLIEEREAQPQVTVSSESQPVEDVKEKPKRRRTRKVKSVDSSEATESAAETAQEVKEEKTAEAEKDSVVSAEEEKPKRRRTRKAKAADAVNSEGSAAPVQAKETTAEVQTPTEEKLIQVETNPQWMSTETPQEPETKKPRKRATRKPKSTESVKVKETAQTTSETPQAVDAGVSEKPKRVRRKKSEEIQAEEAAAKPKRVRKPRKKALEHQTSEVAAVPEEKADNAQDSQTV